VDTSNRYLKEITRADLDRFRIVLLTTKNKRIGRPLSPTSVVKLLRTTGRMFKMAVRWGVLDVNSAAELEKPSIPKPKTRFLTLEEFEAVEEAAPEWLRPILRTPVATGMRLKEVAGLSRR
jgi:integrase